METIGISFLKQTPSPLKFGTSGLRAKAADLTDLECYINICGFIDYIKSIDLKDGGIKAGAEIYLAGDYRPSTPRIMKALVRAITDSGCQVRNCGNVPSPAVAYCGIANHCASIMVTGSHIPEDRNGIKPNKANGEVLKSDEAGMAPFVAAARERIYATLGTAACLFDEDAMLVADVPMPEIDREQTEFYIKRYTDFFPVNCLQGRKISIRPSDAMWLPKSSNA